jgi:hypothetical protein
LALLALLALATDLGKGEAEAIAIAHERNALLILDDGLARRHAKVVGVTLTGTLGVLVKAKTAWVHPDGSTPGIETNGTRLPTLGANSRGDPEIGQRSLTATS